MKQLKKISVLVVLLSSILFFSCSKENDNTTQIEFPELKEVTLAPNSQSELAFNASQDWRLSSSMTWCSLIDSSEELQQTIYGAAGSQTIKMKVSDSGSSFDTEDKAEITLTIAGESKVICRILRSSKEYLIEVLDAEGNSITAENPIVVEYEKAITISVKGNFVWAIANGEETKPEWVTFTTPITGTVDANVEVGIKLAEGWAKSEQQSVIKIGSANDPTKFELPIVYKGIPEDKIEFSISANQIYGGYKFLADGTGYNSMYQGEITNTYDGPLNFSVAARNDEYTVVCFKYNQWGDDVMPDYENWVNVEDDKSGNLSVSVNPNTSDKERIAHLIILPKSINEEVKGDYGKLLDKTDENYWTIKSEYDDFIALRVTQAAAPTEVFSATYNGQLLPLVKKENASDIYGTENVYVLTLANQTYDEIVLKPLGLSSWVGAQPDTYFKGENTAWDGVEVESAWDMSDYTTLTNVWGISANTTGASRQMTISFYVEELIGYILIEQPN